MDQKPTKQIVFIVNPISGTRRKRKLELLAKQVLDPAKYTISFHYTQYSGHGGILAADAVRAGVDVVVAVGGDGSINQVASRLIGTDVRLGIIPMGSGNGLAHNLKIPMNPVQALKLIDIGHVSPIDTATANGHFFVSIAGVGFDAWIAQKFAGSKRRGFWTYLWLILSEFMPYKARTYKLVLDGVQMERQALFVSFANSDQFGYKTKIAPDATVTDGLLDVCIVGKPSVFSIPRLSHLLFINEIGKLRDVEIIKAREISLDYTEDQVFNLDGDPLMVGKSIQVVISPLSLNVIIP